MIATLVAGGSSLTSIYMVLAIVMSIIGIQGAIAAIYARRTKPKRDERELRDKDIAKALLWFKGIPRDEAIEGVEVKGAPIQLHDLAEDVTRLIHLVGQNGKPLADKVDDIAKKLDEHMAVPRVRRALPTPAQKGTK